MHQTKYVTNRSVNWMGFNIKLEMDKRQKNNLMTLLTLIVVLGQFILWIMLLLLDKVW